MPTPMIKEKVIFNISWKLPSPRYFFRKAWKMDEHILTLLDQKYAKEKSTSVLKKVDYFVINQWTISVTQ